MRGVAKESSGSVPEFPAFMSCAAFAKAAMVSKATVSKWINGGQLPAVRLGPKSIRILVSDAKAFLEKSKIEKEA